MATTTAAASLAHSYHQPSKMAKFAPLDAIPGSDESNDETPQQEEQKRLPDKVKNFSQILKLNGFMNVDENVFNTLLAMYPTVNADLLSTTDSMLANLYKCDVYHDGCKFTAPDESTFLAHLNAKQPKRSLYCFYCTKADHLDGCPDGSTHTVFDQAEQLIEHIKEQHGRLNYQCNLCFYRAFSAEHVFIHQAIEHLSKFEETLKQVIFDKKAHTELSLIEEHFLEQTIDSNETRSDDETEVENSDNDDDGESSAVSSNVKISKHSANELCKIICCGAAVDSEDTDGSLANEFFTKHAFKLEKYPDSSKFLCVYCDPESLDQNEDFLVHAVSTHNSFPILAYDLDTERIDYDLADFDISDEEVAGRIVSEFRDLLVENAIPRSFDDSLMNVAFDYYSSVNSADDSPSKGLKRKLDSDAESGDASVGVASTSAESTPKRRRILDRLLSEPVLKRTKRVATAFATAAMALGFYHLTHYLPESVQSYLN